ncbi:MAG: heavy metal translocating P-type ATPase [Chlamydiota bacterium]
MAPYLFDASDPLDIDAATSPFLTPSSKQWARHTELKKAFSSAFLLVLAFASSWTSSPLSLFFVTLVYFLSGTSALFGALEDVYNLEINIDTLMMLAAFLSLLIGSPLEGALLLVLFDLSGAMEEWITKKADSTLGELNTLHPQKALVLEKDALVEKSLRDISLGEQVLVKVGECVPLDGTILSGDSLFDLAHLTGESLPVRKSVENFVPAGAKNCKEAIVVNVTKTAQDSTMQRMISLIEEAAARKPKMQTLLDRFGKKYASFVMGSSLGIALFLPLFYGIGYLGTEGSIYRALTFLITASPCALMIGAPTAYLSALSACTKRGILLKSGATLDALNACKSICFDKTGTLTSGKSALTEFTQIQGDPFSREQAMICIKSLERHVAHPIATAVEEWTRSLPCLPVEGFSHTLGQGIEGHVRFEKERYFVAIGNREFLEKRGAILPGSTGHKPSSFVLIGEALFSLRLEEEIREGASKLIEALHQRFSLETFMLTGDEKSSAFSVAKKLDIQGVFAHLQPEDKLSLVETLSKKAGLIMVGDGMNDAPSLARASVGISLGTIGSSAALQAADAILLGDRIEDIDWLLGHAHSTYNVVRQNVYLAIATILLASSAALLGQMPLWLSVILHEGGTVLVGCNSLRLLPRSRFF